MIRCRSKCHPNASYLYMRYKPPKKIANEIKSYWRCTECRRIREKEKLPGEQSSLHLVHTENGEFIGSDPDIGHNARCVPYSDSRVEAEELVQQTKIDLKKGTKRPPEAFKSMRAKVTDFDDSKKTEIENNLPSYKKICRTFYRCSAVSKNSSHYKFVQCFILLLFAFLTI